MEKDLVLVINPGSTSTKLAVYKGESLLEVENLNHSREDLEKFEEIRDRKNFRETLIKKWLIDKNIEVKNIQAIVARGGMLRPIPSGVYRITDKMIEDLYLGVGGQHASNLGGILAKSLGDKLGIVSYIVDPVAVDELEDLARISGLNLIVRKSSSHALNIKAVTYRRSREIGKDIEKMNLIVAHLGGGISICPIKNGRIIDVNNANEMGPFSPERTGSLPIGDLANLCLLGNYSYREVSSMLRGQGGLMSYLNTNDGRLVEEKIAKGDRYAKLIYDAMIYQIAKEIGAMSTVVKGNVDTIILTGGLSYSDYIVNNLKTYIDFISEVVVYPGEDEMNSLNMGVLRVFDGEEVPKNYDEVISDD